MDRVLALADQLRSDGVDAHLDQYEVAPKKGWAMWTLDELENADYVLVICTEIYRRRFKGEGDGLGVRWEGSILTNELYAKGAINSRLIPVIFSGDSEKDIPIVLRGATWYQLGGESSGYESLYRHLTDQRAIEKPDLGKLRRLAPRKRQTRFEGLKPSPSYNNDDERRFGEELLALRRERKKLAIDDRDTAGIDERILEIKRIQRDGAQIHPGHVLMERFSILEEIGEG